MIKCNNDNQINTRRSNDSKELKKILLKDYQKRWDYQKINNYKNTIIEGKFKKKVNLIEKNEPKIYNNIKIYPQPDTKRTILPEYAPVSNEKNSKKIVDTKSFSQRKVKSQGKKVTKIKNKESNYDEIPPNRKHIKNSKYQDYKITQITTLPGGLTRDLNCINDDKKDMNQIKEKKNGKTCFINKIKNDYCSNVACLQNTLSNNDKDKPLKRGKSYNKFNYKNTYKSNIFNYGYRGKIKREKNKERPLSSDYYNYNTSNKEENLYNNKKYRNVESYQTFDMLKPSSIFQKKYELRVMNL